MSDSDSTPPAQKVTKEEIVAAIDQICEKRGQPVVRSKDIAELETIEIGVQRVNEHLDELEQMDRVNFLKYGQGGVWWLPEGEDATTEMEGIVQWDNIDAEEIPHEVLADLPEFQDQTYWEGAQDTWGTVSVGAMFLAIVGVLAEALRGAFPTTFPSGAEDFLAVAIIGGFSVGMVSLGLVLALVNRWIASVSTVRTRKLKRETADGSCLRFPASRRKRSS